MAKKQKLKLKQVHAHNKKLLFLVVSAVAVVGAVMLRVSNAATTEGGGGTGLGRLKIIQTAAAEVGNREYNERVRMYTGRSDQPEWCAYFLSWVMNASGYPLRTDGNWRVPAVFVSDNNVKDILIQNGAWVDVKKAATSPPRTGDILIFGRSHTGFAAATYSGSGRLYTIEGNSAAAGKPNSVARNNYDSLEAAGIIGWGNVDVFINRSPASK